jgi:16S rRNA (guanine966-N2)-methyltransferase
MSDKVRGAIFNILGDVTDLTVLDAFAGSGALGFEALSRGAARVVAIDNDKNAKQTLDKNIYTLGLQSRVKAIQANTSAWSDNNPEAIFDLVLCDPPYDHTQPALIQKLTKHLTPTGILVLSWPGKVPPLQLEGLHFISQKSYGDAQLIFYRR